MAGVGAIILLILLLKCAFSSIGEAFSVERSKSTHPSDDEFLLWGLGVMVVTHIITWLGITYYDQFYVVWFMQLAAVSSVSASCVKAASVEKDIVEASPNETYHLEPEMQLQKNLR
jgi:hypothetical protein